VAITIGDIVSYVRAKDTKLDGDLAGAQRKAQTWVNGFARTMQHAVGDIIGRVVLQGVERLAKGVADVTWNLAASTAPAMESARAFAALSGGAEQAERNLRAVQDATFGTIGRYDAMSVANRLLSMRLAETDADLNNIVKTAYVLRRAIDPQTGVTAAVEDFAMMLANQSIMRLDQFGISSGRVTTRVNELMASVAGMTRETAFMQAVMEEAGPKVEALAGRGDDVATRLARVKAQLTDIRTAAGERLQGLLDGLLTTAERGVPVLDRLANGLTRLAQPLAAAIKVAGPLIIDELNRIIDAVAPYGEGITHSLAEGIRRGTVYVLAAMMVLRGIITYWLKPGSPPKLLPDLTDWGKGAANAWFKGWTQADYSALRDMSGALQNVLAGLVAEGALEQGQANPLLRALRAQIAGALNELRATGSISEGTFAGIRAAGGMAGAQAESLARAYLATQAAGARMRDIQAQMAQETDYEALRGLNAQLEIAKQQAAEAGEAYDAERAKIDALTEESNLQQQIAGAMERAAQAGAAAAKSLADMADEARRVFGELPKPDPLENPWEALFAPEQLQADARALADTIMSELIGTEATPGPLPSLRQNIAAVKDAVVILSLTILGLGIAALIGWAAALGPVGIAIAGIGAALAALTLAWATNWMGMRDKLTEIWQGEDGKGGIKGVLADIKTAVEDIIDRTRVALYQLGLLDLESVPPESVSPEVDKTAGWTTREKAFGPKGLDTSGGPQAAWNTGKYATGLEAWISQPTYFQGWVGEGSEPELLQITPRSKLDSRRGAEVKPTIIINNPAPEPAEDSINRAWGRMQFLYGT